MFWRKRKGREQDLERELRSDLDLEAEEQRENGLTLEGARYAAQRALGNATSVKEDVREMWGGSWLESTAQDAQYGIRVLRKSPAFTTMAVLILAVGIGANTAIFSVVNTVILQPLPYRDPDRLLVLQEKISKLVAAPIPVSTPDFLDFERQNRSFQSIAGFRSFETDLSGAGGTPQTIRASRISWNLFPMLGLHPFLGRTFTAEEDRRRIPVVVLSYPLWRSRFGSDRAILGESISLGQRPYTVIGVMPRGIEFPLTGLLGDKPAAVWVPMSFTPAELNDIGNNYSIGVIVRLRPGATIAQARSDVQRIAHHIQEEDFSTLPGVTLEALVTPLSEQVVEHIRTLLFTLLAAVGLVLFIACANLANLLLIRATGRQKEIATRVALGAARMRLFRQFLVESLVLTAAGGLLGLALAAEGVRLLLNLTPEQIPRAHDVHLDVAVLAFTAGLAVATGILFGVIPSLLATRRGLSETLKEGATNASADGGKLRVRNALVIGEIALALVLLIAAALMIKSFAHLRAVDPGFQPEHVLSMSINLPKTRYTQAPQVRAFFQELLDRIQRLPGVKTAAAGNELPMSMDNDRIFAPEGYQFPPGSKWPRCTTTWALGSYFQTLGIPLLKGRLFTEDDRAKSLQVAIVSKSTARHFWPGQDVLGKRLKYGQPDSKNPWLTIVGVVPDVKHESLDQETVPTIYQPFAQEEDARIVAFGRDMSFAVRTTGDPGSLPAALQEKVWSLDSQLAVKVRTMADAIDESVAPRRFNMLLLTIFAAFALSLALIGIYGVISYSVAQRTHELGIRTALGAQPRDLVKLVVSHGMVMTFAGLAIGISVAIALTRFLSSLLFDVRPTDTGTFIAAPVALGIVAILACYIPARRASRADPILALRHE